MSDKDGTDDIPTKLNIIVDGQIKTTLWAYVGKPWANEWSQGNTKLADISRSTRGVVILMSDRQGAVRILDDAKRLNMMDGHFVWLWIDTAATITVKNSTDEERDKEKDRPEERSRRSSENSDISDMHISYLLRNDHNLLFTRNYGVESSKSRIRQAPRASAEGIAGAGELPAGLLSLKPLSIKVDRHLVKGAVRLLVATLKLVIERSPQWMLNNLVKGPMSNNCWKNVATKENSFISEFARFQEICPEVEDVILTLVEQIPETGMRRIASVEISTTLVWRVLHKQLCSYHMFNV
ncbi:hypothetical protein NQ318_005867 [Aromia moschata]|uniref:Uncharacterized protein n=1 Tax=Aromia moschata TaxID=1265417 RepID=A0AAV8YQT3_9CUCU|nr:hypothetical protein NQ318_005867 [Aromia moschata]